MQGLGRALFKVSEDKGDKRTILVVLGVAIVADLFLVMADISRAAMSILGIVLIGAFILALHGILQPAGIVTPLAGLFIFTYLAFNHYGIRDTSLLGFPVIIVAASLMNGRRGAVVIGLVCMGIVAIMGWLDLGGFQPPLIPTHNTLSDYAASGVALTLMTALQWAVIGRLKENVARANMEVIERQRAESKLQQTADEMRALYELGVALSSGQDLYHTLRALVAELRRWLTADTFYVGLYDDQTGTISFPLYLTYDDDLIVPARNLREKPGLTQEVIENRKTIYIPDIAKPEEQERHNIITIVNMGIRSYIGIPLIMNERVIGIMSMQAREADAYSPEQLRLLETLASQVAITVERLRLLEALQTELSERKRTEVTLEQRVNENYFLYNIGVLLFSAPNLIEAMRALSAELGHLMPVDTFFLAFYDPATDVLSFPLFLRDGVEVAIASWKRQERPSLSSEVIAQQKTIYIEDVLNPETQRQHPHVPIGEMKVHAWLGLPLIVQKQVVGVLSVQSHQPHAYTRAHIRLLEALAVQLNVTIERLRLFEALQNELTERAQAEQQAQRRAEQLATMGEISRAISTLQNLDSVLEIIYRQIQRLAAVDAFYIALYDQDSGQISFPIMYDLGMRYNEPTIPLKPDTWIAQVINTGQPFMLHRTEKELEMAVDRTVGNAQRKSASVLLVPLWLGARVFGVLSIQSYTMNAYSEEIAGILIGIGQQVAIALENARLYSGLQQELSERKQAEEKIQHTATQLSMLNEIGRAVTALNSPENVLDIVRQQVERAIPMDAFNVYLYDAATNTLSYPYVYENEKIWQEPDSIMKPGSSLSQVLQTGKSVIRHLTPEEYSNYSQQPHSLVGDYSRITASYLFVPLINMGKVFGALSTQSYELDKYNDDQLRLLEGVALQAATAIENARLFSGLQQELMERKQVEVALRVSEARLKAVIDQFPYDLWVCDAEGRYLLQNRAGEKTFPGLMGKKPLEYEGAPREVRERWDAEHQQALKGEIFHSGIVEEVLDGQLHSLIITVAPIVVDERIIGLVGISVDVSELRQAEAAVRKLNDELEQRVKERTKQLEAANKELETFSYSVSHDLRAPLRGINGFARILSQDFSHQLDPLGQGFLEKIMLAAKEMNDLIDSLLTLSRLNQAELHFITVDLSDLAAEILAQLQHNEPDRAVTCRVTAGALAHADAVLMRNVLENLLGNAWKYSSKNPHAEIEFGLLVKDDQTIYFVRDNGAGFDMQYADKLFGAFTRLHSATEFPGHGIGLATVQRIIHRHGGQIWAEAQVNKGATFYFTLGTDSDISLSI